MEKKRGHVKGTPKTGGRKKGTPNKTTAINKGIITNLIAEYSQSGLMAKDFRELEPKDRLNIAEKMMSYVIPKLQSVEASVDVAPATNMLAEKLIELAELNE